MTDNSSKTINQRSDAICIARVLCIVGMVYVHAWTGLSGGELELARGTPQETLRWILMEVFGRSSVPLLGMISGWLVARTQRIKSWRQHITKKARSILLPMVLWNILAIFLVSGTAWLFTLPAPVPHSLSWLLEETFIISHPPDINVQMPFLRDLFLCMVAAPLLLRLSKYGLLVVALIAGVGHVLTIGPPIILRPSLLMFFTLGMWAQRTDTAEIVARWPLFLAALPLAILMPLHLYTVLPAEPPFTVKVCAILDLMTRLSAALAVWNIASRLTQSSMAKSLMKIEPYMFFFFCFHLIALWLGGPLLGKLTGTLGTPLYPIYLILQPFLILALAFILAQVLLRHAPKAAHILSGGRLHARE